MPALHNGATLVQPKKDPNEDLENFDNFNQDYTLRPDTHNNPPVLDPVTEKSYKPKYIPITEVPYPSKVSYYMQNNKFGIS